MQGNNSLPDGWEWTTLGDVADYINGRAFKPAEWEETGRPIIRIQNLTGSSSTLNRTTIEVEEKYVIRDGDLLISWSATLGAFIYRGEEAVLNQHIFKVQPKVNKLFLYYLVKAFIGDLLRQVHGSGMQHITKGKFEATPIPLPPLPEQERIVAKIEELFTRLDAGVAELKEAKARLKRYRQSVLHAAVTGELTREWREAHQDELEPASELLERILVERRRRWEEEELSKMRAKRKEPKDDKWKEKFKPPLLPESNAQENLPQGWVLTTLGFVAEHRLGKMLDQVKNKGKFVPYLRNINVRWFGFDLSDVQQMRVTEDELDKVSVKTGDLVVCEGGEPGRASVWERGGESFVIQKALHRVRTEDGVLPWYLAYRLAADAWAGRLEEYFTGSTIMHFTGQALNLYLFALPPTEEQKIIVSKIERRLSVADEIDKDLKQGLIRAERLRQSILQQAFMGQL